MSLLHTEFININNQSIKSEIDTSEEYLNEEILVSDSTSLDLNGDREKCGEIFISTSESFILVCVFCDDCFDNMRAFGKHIQGKHLCVKQRKSRTDIDPAEIVTASTNIKTETFVKCKDKSRNSLYENSSLRSDSEFGLITFTNKRQITEDPDLFCVTCNRQYKNKKTFREHQVRHTTTNRGQENSKTEYNDETKIRPGLYCEICNRHFKTTNIFRNHAARHETIPLALQHDPNYLKCKYCDKQCSDHVELDAHKKTHVGKRRFACSYCLKCFQTNQQRKLHMHTHTGERPFKCDECSKAFAHVTNLKRHIQAHLGIKRYACEICGKQFLQNSAREAHMRTHTGEKPFQCEECGRSFILCSKLTEHRKRHTGIKNFKCDICGSLFYSNKSLKGHKVKHSDARPYHCSECGSNFPRRKALQAHVKIHSGLKEYVCILCGKEFSQAAGLYSHKKSHGEKLDMRCSDD